MSPSRDEELINHRATYHTLCPDCPLGRKFQERVFLPIVYLATAGMGLFALWYSPLIYHNYRIWWADVQRVRGGARRLKEHH